jgi:hypothetical protein
MPVVTRSMMNNSVAIVSKVQKEEIKKTKKLTSVNINNENINIKPIVTFITKEEYEKAGFIDADDGGYINNKLIAACIPAINNSKEDFILFDKYVDKDYVKSKDEIYVVAPIGYYWRLRKCICAGWMYDLDKLDV